MNQSSHDQQAALCIAFVQARWHADIVDNCRAAFVAEIGRRTGGSATIEVFDVPGAFELPLQARSLARTGRYAAVVAAAFVVDGGIYRHDFIAEVVVADPCLVGSGEWRSVEDKLALRCFLKGRHWRRADPMCSAMCTGLL